MGGGVFSFCAICNSHPYAKGFEFLICCPINTQKGGTGKGFPQIDHQQIWLSLFLEEPCKAGIKKGLIPLQVKCVLHHHFK